MGSFLSFDSIIHYLLTKGKLETLMFKVDWEDYVPEQDLLARRV